ncbi:MAG TPA: VanW family protein [Patescibacteria group bacterium]|nr:VanW family protein [Patescibacteria group bacterium]
MYSLIFYILVAFANPQQAYLGASRVELATRSFSLENRYDNEFVNGVFRDNILLTLKYLDGSVDEKTDISWEEVQKPFSYEFTLEPGKGFAFHDQILPEYQDEIVKTTNANFNFQDGFKTDGLLYGDGVCHLASLIHWAAKDAGLTSVYFASHDFAKINEVPKEYGVSIKTVPGQFANSSRQNLYIVNNFDKPVTFTFVYDGTNLTIGVFESQVNSS